MNSDRFLDYFEESVAEAGKLFIPDNMDRRLASNLLRFIDDQGEDYSVLRKCVHLFLRNTYKRTVTLKDFSHDIDNTFSLVRDEEASRREFLDTVAKTKAIMETKQGKGDQHSL